MARPRTVPRPRLCRPGARVSLINLVRLAIHRANRGDSPGSPSPRPAALTNPTTRPRPRLPARPTPPARASSPRLIHPPAQRTSDLGPRDAAPLPLGRGGHCRGGCRPLALRVPRHRDSSPCSTTPRRRRVVMMAGERSSWGTTWLRSASLNRVLVPLIAGGMAAGVELAFLRLLGLGWSAHWAKGHHPGLFFLFLFLESRSSWDVEGIHYGPRLVGLAEFLAGTCSWTGRPRGQGLAVNGMDDGRRADGTCSHCCEALGFRLVWAEIRWVPH